jgi:hypothetical protein
VIVSSVPVSAGHRYIPTFSEAVIAIRSTAAYDKVKTPLVGGRLTTWGFAILAILLEHELWCDSAHRLQHVAEAGTDFQLGRLDARDRAVGGHQPLRR